MADIVKGGAFFRPLSEHVSVYKEHIGAAWEDFDVGGAHVHNLKGGWR